MGVLGPRHPLIGAIFTVQARRVRAEASNSWVKSLLSPPTGGTRYIVRRHGVLAAGQPLHRLYIVVADHPSGSARTFLRQQARRLFHYRDKHRKLWPRPSLNGPPALPNSKQLSKLLFLSLYSVTILWASSPPFTLEIMRNQHLPPNLLSDKRQQTYRSSRNLARFLLRRVRLKFEVPAMISTDQVITVDPKAAHLASTLELLGATSLPDLPDCKW